jgi:uncharacterized membrane protein (DUF373 family)
LASRLSSQFLSFRVLELGPQNLRKHRFELIGSNRVHGFSVSIWRDFTVIIALEFKRSLLVSTERQHSVVQARTVILIALLAIIRKRLILDVGHGPTELFGLSAAIIALGIVYWLVRDQDPSI